MVKITVLDGYATNPGDLSWDALSRLGKTGIFERTPAGQVVERSKGAMVILTNKTVLDKSVLHQLPDLKCICVLATGYNVVDIGTATELGITVCNVRGYAAQSVAQHVFALLLELTNRTADHAQSVLDGHWGNQDDFSYTLSPTVGLAGKTMGIYGFGQIGQKVAAIALAFDMGVVAHHKHPERDKRPGVTFVSFDKMMRQSDMVSLHAPLSTENQGIINRTTLKMMKQSAYLINTGRGGLVVEEDLKTALESGWIAGAGLDVISEEPPKNGNILFGVRNCIVTPHNAWATREARQKLLDETVENVRAFLEGIPRNVV